MFSGLRTTSFFFCLTVSLLTLIDEQTMWHFPWS